MKNPFKRQSDPFAAGRYDSVFKSARMREKKRPWILRHRWAWISLTVLLLLGAAAGYAVYFYFHLEGKLKEDVPGVAPPEDSLDPFNVLLVGSDSRDGLTDEEQEDLGANAVEGQRADTIILAHIDPETNDVTMVQFPRDLYVPLATGGSNKINSALETGTGDLVETIEDLTQLDINRYAQVNIAGFRDVVDAIGGVELCITEPVPFDPQTGIEITQEEIDESPLIKFDGDRALRFVRSRNFATGDFQRIQNQQRFLSAAINKVTNLGTLLNLGRIQKLARAAGDNLKIDENTGLKDLYRLGQRFRSFDPEHYEAYTAPNLGIGENEAGSVVLPDMTAMKRMFEAIDANESPQEADGVPALDVSTIKVGVYNGTLKEGVASSAADDLKAATTVNGNTIEVVEIANADRSNYKGTVIRFDPKVKDAEEKAQLIAAAIPSAKVEEMKVDDDVDVEVVVGRGKFRTEKIVMLVPIDLPEPGEVPEGCR